MNDNVLIGYRSGFSGMNTNKCVFIGAYSGQVNNNGAANVFLGYQSGNANILGNNNTFIGYTAGLLTTAGNNTFLGYQAGNINAGGTSNTYLGYNANGTAALTNSCAVGNGAYVTANNNMEFGDANVVGWGFGVNPNAANAIEVGTNGTNGNGAYCTIGGAWVNGSSQSFKEDFQNIDGVEVLKKLNDLVIKRWKYIGTNEYHIGPIAEEFYTMFKTGNDNKHISTIDPSGVALVAIKELNLQLQKQKNSLEINKLQLQEKNNEILALKKSILDLDERLNSLERK